jgi:hypothetical protein
MKSSVATSFDATDPSHALRQHGDGPARRPRDAAFDAAAWRVARCHPPATVGQLLASSPFGAGGHSVVFCLRISSESPLSASGSAARGCRGGPLAPSPIPRMLERVLPLSGLVLRALAQLAAHIAHPLQRAVETAPPVSGGFLGRLVDLGGRLPQAAPPRSCGRAHAPHARGVLGGCLRQP